MGAGLDGEHLCAGGWLERGGRGWSADEFASFGQDQQIIASERDNGGAETLFFPADFAGCQFNAAETGGWLEARISPAMNPVEKAAVIDGRGVMARNGVIGRPGFLGLTFFDLQQNCAGAVAGRNEDGISDYQWRGGADGVVDRRPKRKLEKYFSDGGIQRDQVRTGDYECVTTPIDRRGRGRGIAGLV